jgi:hypothetical protein
MFALPNLKGENQMPRVVSRSAFPVLLSLLVCASLVTASVVLAAKPRKNAQFRGHTNALPINGFLAPVTFKVSSNGRSLSNFTFGTFGCFGAGGFRPGVNPYTGHSLLDAGAVQVSLNGNLSGNTSASYTLAGQTTTTTISISGRFNTPKSASGTITFSQKATGGGVNTSCGPAKRAFSASAH